MMPRPAAFIDRDGVLNEDRGCVGRVAHFHGLPGAIDALSQLQAAGFSLVIGDLAATQACGADGASASLLDAVRSTLASQPPPCARTES